MSTLEAVVREPSRPGGFAEPRIGAYRQEWASWG
jgi:hypothetical protein